MEYNCPDGMDCDRYHLCNEDRDVGDTTCPLEELLDDYHTRQMPVDELIGRN